MKRFVIADIHGQYFALKAVLELANFNYKKDQLIFTGDICDRGLFTYECMEELLKIENLIYIKGNHDIWFYKWIKDMPYDHYNWLENGGKSTLRSYKNNRQNVPQSHIDLLDNAKFYYITEDNKFFSHAGLNPNKDLLLHREYDFTWDRGFIETAYYNYLGNKELNDKKLTEYDEVYIGHTGIHGYFKENKAKRLCEVWCMDTGAGHGKKLTMMNIDTKEMFEAEIQ